MASKTPDSDEYIAISDKFEEAKKNYQELANNIATDPRDLSFAYGKFHGLSIARSIFWTIR